MSAFLNATVMGFAIAAPVGPIGLLCIRRSLADGRAAGLATGLGAAAADASYGLAVALGFAATGLLAYAQPMQVLGGLLLIWLGSGPLRAFFAPPRTPRIEGAGGGATGIATLRAFTGTYLLTLSNPATILAFLGMVAALGAEAAAGPVWLVAGLFCGSALWWLILVHLALFAGRWLTPQALRWIDLGSGLVLVGWGAGLVLKALF
ncbi:putative LysE/RhtB family amino acid efflux pump [Gemmobacter aquatilis]|uniref:Putative LysE/RhtB family amino acid efflux pump n=1 Tax=Gemmobacter aquatilis TaxID=933059 RepID=A0A1H8H1Z3_9RHOB|nr:LysE family transporter [Gemmobacter aquatilis]SEN50029.1 putative LysE/RhtB family amino acid efflux pump [Gemmobacter aquatilis]